MLEDRPLPRLCLSDQRMRRSRDFRADRQVRSGRGTRREELRTTTADTTAMAFTPGRPALRRRPSVRWPPAAPSSVEGRGSTRAGRRGAVAGRARAARSGVGCRTRRLRCLIVSRRGHTRLTVRVPGVDSGFAEGLRRPDPRRLTAGYVPAEQRRPELRVPRDAHARTKKSTSVPAWVGVPSVRQPGREHLDGVEPGAGGETVGLVQCADESGRELGMTEQELHRVASIRRKRQLSAHERGFAQRDRVVRRHADPLVRGLLLFRPSSLDVSANGSSRTAAFSTSSAAAPSGGAAVVRHLRWAPARHHPSIVPATPPRFRHPGGLRYPRG